MIQDEHLFSDVVYMGSKIIRIGEFKIEFPDWYEHWSDVNKEHELIDYVLMPDYDYGVSAILNAVYSVDIEKATAEYLCSFENEKNEGNIYYPPIKMGNVLLFVPCNARRWAYYDLDTCTWSYENIPAEFIRGNGMAVKSWVQNGNQLIFMPGSIAALISMDLKTKKVSYHDCLKAICQENGTLPIFSSIIACEDSVLLFTNTESNIYEIDTKTMQLTRMHKISLGCKGILTAAAIPGTDWICLLEHDRASRILKWNVKTGATEEITDLPICSDQNSSPGLILGFCFDYSGLYIIPQQDNCIVKIDCHENKASRIDLHTEINLMERKDAFYHRWGYGLSFTVLTYNGYENTSTVFLPYDFSIAEIDFDKGILYNRRKWQVGGIEKLIKNQMKNLTDGVYFENNFYGLQEYLDDLIEK